MKRPRRARVQPRLALAVLLPAAALAIVVSLKGSGADVVPARPSAYLGTAVAPSTAPAQSMVSTTPPEIATTKDEPRIEPGTKTGVLITPAGVVAPVLEGDEDGWIVRTPCGRRTHLAKGVFVPAADVVIDAGHGGAETGAVGRNRLAEKVINLSLAKRISELLEAQGLRVVLTRTADYRVTLYSRAEVAKRLGAAALVSVHLNAEPDGPSNRPGSETYYQMRSAQSRRLAGLVYEEVFATLAPLGRAWVADADAGAKYRPNDTGTDYYGVLRHSAGVPATLVELAFISNPVEEALVQDPAVFEAMSRAVSRGVVRALTTDDQGSGFVEPYTRPTDTGGGDKVPPGCLDPPLN